MEKYLQFIKSISITSKYQKWYCNIIQKNKNNKKSKYYEKHHIVPKSFNLGGEKDINNYVYVTIREHFILHKLLTKMFNGIYKQKMQYAYWSMCHLCNKKTRNISSKYYQSAKKEFLDAKKYYIHSEETRKKISEKLKGKMVGSKNPMFGIKGYKHPLYGKPSYFRGHKHTEDTKYKIHLNNIKRKQSPNGYHSNETKNKISNSLKNKEYIWITNGNENKHILSSELSKYSSEWIKGRFTDNKGNNNPNSKKWIITDLNSSKSVITDNLKEYCLTNDLNYQSLMVRHYNNKPYKGYIIDTL